MLHTTRVKAVVTEQWTAVLNNKVNKWLKSVRDAPDILAFLKQIFGPIPDMNDGYPPDGYKKPRIIGSVSSRLYLILFHKDSTENAEVRYR